MSSVSPSPDLYPDDDFDGDDGISWSEFASAVRDNARLLLAAPLAAGVIALGITYLIPPTFTSTTTLMPPQQSQGTAASMLASLGPLAGLAGVGGGALRNMGEQYVALLQSVTVSDRLIDQFKLMSVYDEKYRVDTRKELAKNVRIALGKKDGMLTVSVDDHSPQRAAEMANAYVDELRRMTSELAVTEAQQRRLFFEQQMRQSRDRLVAAQQALQDSGFSSGALRTEPRAAAEGYARLSAEVTAAEVRLQVLKGTLTDTAPEVRQQQATLNALRSQLARSEQPTAAQHGPDYVSRYREFKYQETLFELFSRQYEMARVDESKEGALIQVVDAATPPEKKSRPKRALTALVAAVAGLIVAGAYVAVRRRLGAR